MIYFEILAKFLRLESSKPYRILCEEPREGGACEFIACGGI